MGMTSIQWTDRTINPLRAVNRETGAIGHYCEKVSPGCQHCYASAWNERVRPIGSQKLGTGLSFDARNRSKVDHVFETSRLTEVLKRRTPTKWFWCDMTDMFAEWVPDDWIDTMLAAMALTPDHTHQILTKRADRMHRYFSEPNLSTRVANAMQTPAWMPTGRPYPRVFEAWPLPNVWVGVSAEDQQRADERVPLLVQTLAAVRFVSAEPLIGAINFCAVPSDDHDNDPEFPSETPLGNIDWIVVGGESGRKARPCSMAWIRAVADQCRSAGVACFVKQLGSDPYEPYSDGSRFADVTLRDRKGGDLTEWEPELRVRQFPESRW